MADLLDPDWTARERDHPDDPGEPETTCSVDTVTCKCGSIKFFVGRDNDQTYVTWVQCIACGKTKVVHDG